MHDKLWALPITMADDVLRQLYAETCGAQETTPQALVSLSTGQDTSTKDYEVHKGVAVIDINGALTRTGLVSSWSGKRLAHGQDSIRKAIATATADAAVRTILLCINSPGGVVHGTKELADYIAASPKPMAAYADGLCASAAFWLAAATGRIFAPQTAMLGSVGVIHIHTDYSRAYDKAGISITPITAGTYKAVGTDSKPLSDADLAYLQSHVTAIHEIFTADVQRGLALTAPKSTWGEAQLFLAQDALGLGLVSHIVQDKHAAITALAEETIMDKQTLLAQYPELVSEIQAEAVQNSKSTQEKEQQALFAVLRACVGEEGLQAVTATLAKCSAANLTSEQIEALAPSIAVKVQEKELRTEAATMQNILTTLQSTSSAPLSVTAQTIPATPVAQSPLVADAAQRARATAKTKE